MHRLTIYSSFNIPNKFDGKIIMTLGPG